MKKIKINLFASYLWQWKSNERGDVIFFSLPGITFIHDRTPIVVGGLMGTQPVLLITFTWLFLTFDLLRVEFFSKDKEQDDNTDAGHPGTIIFHEEES